MFTEYITLGGERWDTIAYKAYGDPAKIYTLIAANKTVPVFSVFGSGVRLLVPILATPTETNPELLPPWKRGLSAQAATAAASAAQFNEIQSNPTGSFAGDSFE
jgi:hypothetical protein